ncbi:hypothetical protein COO60DRAFT_1574970 [Scenedesmus sp. NREL 46B-D3]|nr:hypothetical protein COO60DRAFT_1574970 [Scenedesmus sp. NREL 46B-D3]
MQQRTLSVLWCLYLTHMRLIKAVAAITTRHDIELDVYMPGDTGPTRGLVAAIAGVSGVPCRQAAAEKQHTLDSQWLVHRATAAVVWRVFAHVPFFVCAYT